MIAGSYYDETVPKSMEWTLTLNDYIHKQELVNQCYIVRKIREDQPLRLLLNLLFYHFNHSEPTYKSQRIKLLDVIAACNQLNVNALN